jgi:exopolysaccharide/PEP-CTERM locus tyrosine autokinase
MTKPAPSRTPSLLERAAEIYDFSSGLRVEPNPARAPEPVQAAPAPVEAPTEAVEATPEPVEIPSWMVDSPAPASKPTAEPVRKPVEPVEPIAAPAAAAPRPLRRTHVRPANQVEIDRERLRATGFVLPDGPVTGLAEELRLVKRQLLAAASVPRKGLTEEKRRSILVCSAQPDEGKTFCALNLAISLAAEQDRDVLLVDGDFQKPEILSLLGIEGGPGLVDALADPDSDVESFVIRTDLGSLSVLPAGRQANNVPELLASARTARVLAELAADPRRIVIFDSPPVLMASAAGLLATHVGQALVVVRADTTTESDLGEAIGLLADCAQIGLVLNGAGFAAGGRRYGQYYGYEP